MKVGILKTDGGVHPPIKWAVVTAQQIIEIGSEEDPELTAAGRKLELAIIEVMEKHHANMMQHERDKLATVGSSHIMSDWNEEEHLQEPYEDVMKLIADSPWADHYTQPDVQEYLKNVLRSHLTSVMHIERSVHADGYRVADDHKQHPRDDHDPECEHVKAFKDKWHPGPNTY